MNVEAGRNCTSSIAEETFLFYHKTKPVSWYVKSMCRLSHLTSDISVIIIVFSYILLRILKIALNIEIAN